MIASARRILLFCAVLIVSLAGCAGDEPKITAEFNVGASLSGDLPANPLRWKVISSAINKADANMSTLYGNDVAVVYARSHSQRDYPSGAILSLVTWTQAEDARWFGAKIPAQVKSVEFLTFSGSEPGHAAYSYEKYEGTPLKKSANQAAVTSSERATYLLSQRAAVMP